MPSSASPAEKEISNRTLIRRLLALSWRYRGQCLKVMAYQVVLLFIGLGGLSLTGLGIDFLRRQLDPGAPLPRWPLGLLPPPSWSPMAVLGSIAGGILAFALLRAALNYLYSVAIAILLQQQIVVDLRSQVYNKLQRLSFRFFDDNASGSIINRVTSDAQSVRLFVDGVLLQSVIMLLSLAVYLVYMLNIDAKLTLACLASTPLLGLLSSIFSRRVRPAYRRNRELVDRMVLTLAESVQGVQVIKGFSRETEELAKFQSINRTVKDQQQTLFWQVSLFSPSIGLVTQINVMILLMYGGSMVIAGTLPLGTGLIVFAILLQQFSGQIANIANVVNSVQQSLISARRVFEILDAPVEVSCRDDAIRPSRLAGKIRFEHVSFAYDPDAPVLEDVNFEIQPGQCVAIVGATGSGKSTLLSLIPRFYDPVAGRILIDGVDLREMDLDALRRQIGLVFQESFLFSDTVAANIAFGQPGAAREQVVAAATIAAAHDFIMKLPQGYDTVLREGGANLSGGQRQRLAIARALLLQPSILLLDDPTASIDAHTEQEILDAMENAMKGRTTLVVAHRVSTLRKADSIVVLHQGRVAQMGTHDELMSRKGPYRHMIELQITEEREDDGPGDAKNGVNAP